jgi:hypothetical protein
MSKKKKDQSLTFLLSPAPSCTSRPLLQITCRSLNAGACPGIASSPSAPVDALLTNEVGCGFSLVFGFVIAKGLGTDGF